MRLEDGHDNSSSGSGGDGNTGNSLSVEFTMCSLQLVVMCWWHPVFGVTYAAVAYPRCCIGTSALFLVCSGHYKPFRGRAL